MASPTDIARSIQRRLLVGILVGGIGPFVAFMLLRPYLDAVLSLLIAALLPASMELASLARHRQIDPLSTLSLSALSVAVLLAAIGGIGQVALAKESLVTGAVGAGFLMTLSWRRPAHFYLARQFVTGNDRERVIRFNFAWKAVPVMRDALRASTTVWGIAYLAELSLHLVLMAVLPRQVVLVAGPLLLCATTLFLIAWTIRRMRRIRKRVRYAMDSADSLAIEYESR